MSISTDARVRVRAAQRVAPEHSRARSRSLAYANSPFTFGGASTRGTSSPTFPTCSCCGRSASCAHRRRRTASKIFAYPVQRQRLPESASRISSSDGSGCAGAGRRSRRRARACRSRTAPRPPRRTPAGRDAASPSASPSTVVTSWPSACAASTRHAQTSVPSSSTEHEPHSPCSHAFFAPGNRASRAAQRAATRLPSSRPDAPRR